jgi:putative DNA methylase
MTDEKRLIEHVLPVASVNAESQREKNAGRDYHISTLHPWWARRPLAAVRAAILATLVPASRFPQEPEALDLFFRALSAWRGDEVGMNPAMLAEAQTLIKAEWGDQPPRVIDSFAGGCAIPLEALRLGCEAAGVELNPVAYLVGLASVVWPQQLGIELADDVKRWALWVRDRALTEVEDLYQPIDPSVFAGDTSEQLNLGIREHSGPLKPLGYLWTRTVPCPNPQRAPHHVPLIRSTHVSRRPGRRVALAVVPNQESGVFTFRFAEQTETGETVRRARSSSSSCRLCGASISSAYLAQAGRDKQIGYQLVGVIVGVPGHQGKHYVPADMVPQAVPDPGDLEARLEKLAAESLTVPEDLVQPMGNAGLKSGQTYLYGIRTFADLFTPRQATTLLTLCKYVRRSFEEMLTQGVSEERARVIAAYVGLVVDRVVDRSTTLARWNVGGEKAESPWQKDRLAMLWDFVEVNPFGGISGDYSAAVEAACKIIRHCARSGKPADLRRASATELPFEDASFDVAVIDPPYYDNVSYANSSDFYYVWLKRSIGELFPEHFGGPVAPKKSEIIAAAYRHGGGREGEQAAKGEYEEMMTKALMELQRVLKPGSPLVAVYAHQTTAGWSSLIRSLRSAGFSVVEAWPVETEMAERRGGQDNASLASSIFLVARSRESEERGDWSMIYPELEEIVRERVHTLPQMGITGADLVIASVGAGLRPYTTYKEVELPNGEMLDPEDYLDEVQTLVIKTILSDLMGIDRTSVEAVDPVTQLYVVSRFEYGDTFVPFDEVNTLVHGILAGERGAGVELLGPRGLTSGTAALIDKEGDSVRFRDYQERGAVERLGLDSENGAAASLIDILHRLLWLAEHQPIQVKDYLMVARPDSNHLRLLAQGLSGSSISGKGVGTSEREREALVRLLASWKRIVADNLFARKP